jgi:type VI secretion system protein ImpC
MADASTNPAAALQGLTFEGNEFSSLLNKEFKPKSEEAKSAVEQAVSPWRSRHWSTQRDRQRRAAVDRGHDRRDRPKLSEQVNAIMHHEDFQKLESAWRGLHYLVNNTETDEMLKIRVMNISKKDWPRRSSASRARRGTRARCSRRSTKRSTASSAASPSAAWSATTTSTTARPDVEFLGEMAKVACRGARAVHRRGQPLADADGLPGRNWPTRAT